MLELKSEYRCPSDRISLIGRDIVSIREIEDDQDAARPKDPHYAGDVCIYHKGSELHAIGKAVDGDDQIEGIAG